MTYESTITVASQACAGVSFTIRKMSFGRRLELARKTKRLLGRLEFLRAGEKDLPEETEAALAAGEIDGEFLAWGLVSVDGLEIDGEPAGAENLLEAGPEELVSEVLAAIRRQAGLTEEERKNSESHSTSAKASGPGGHATSAGASVWSANADADG